MSKSLIAVAGPLLLATMLWPAASVAAEPAGPFSSPRAIDGPIEIVTPSVLAGKAALGAEAFAQSCAACHGESGVGSEAGPPLVHIIYEPRHHGDNAFRRAAAEGVRSHHWRFGDMPPVEGVSAFQVDAIIAYIRKLQKVNGIQ